MKGGRREKSESISTRRRTRNRGEAAKERKMEGCTEVKRQKEVDHKSRSE